VRDHPNADPATGAAHACGHNAQIANLIALAYGLVESGVMADLGGNIALMAVPSEEYVEVEYRLGLRREGKIEFLGGKPEMVRLGAFDDVQIAFMTHQSSRQEAGVYSVGGPSNGCIVKMIRYEGKASHAGGSPHQGVNALKAAMIGLQAIDANRETFKDSDHIRVHPIITKGGDLVNIVPADVRLETYVRGAETSAIFEANKKVNRALRAGADAVGATVQINEIPGYLPLRSCMPLSELFEANARDLLGADAVKTSEFSGGSTDMGDISHVIPSIHPYIGGIKGAAHTRTFKVVDLDMVSVIPAKILAMTVIDLLWDGAAEAKRIKAEFKPVFTKDEYLAMWRKFREQK